MGRDRNQTRAALSADGPHICPSLLNCDFGILASEIDSAGSCGAIEVHWDVMDGFFVPNFTYGPPIIASLRPASSLIYDAHLMMKEPQRYLDDFIKAGCDTITIHLEALPDPREALQKIRAGGALAGLAINPPTPVESLDPWLDDVDLVLIMSVMPGFGGQSFDERVLPKLEWVKKHARPGTLIQVDGGVNRKTIARAYQAGARLFVVGSAFYNAPDRKAEYDALVELTKS